MTINLKQTITTTCPECDAEITEEYMKTASFIYEQDRKILRIGFLVETEHNCNK